ncbi:hypothetical protein YTPLAS18_17290 [Nitrospira sp.]|nr:hypothetical protein YTPLAS18_17290 [Nitrospira sp.]
MEAHNKEERLKQVTCQRKYAAEETKVEKLERSKRACHEVRRVGVVVYLSTSIVGRVIT